jgi:hypothetical protein
MHRFATLLVLVLAGCPKGTPAPASPAPAPAPAPASTPAAASSRQSFHRLSLVLPAGWELLANPDAPATADEIQLRSADGKRQVDIHISTPRSSTAPEAFVRVMMTLARQYVAEIASAPEFARSTIVGEGEGAGPLAGDFYGRKGFVAAFRVLPEGAKPDARPSARLQVFGQVQDGEVLLIMTAAQADPGDEIPALVRSVRILPR